jgi:hypothetical protein
VWIRKGVLLMGLCGPENNIGCLKTLFAKFTDKCRKKKDEKVKCTEGDIHPSLTTPSIAEIQYGMIILFTISEKFEDIKDNIYTIIVKR